MADEIRLPFLEVAGHQASRGVAIALSEGVKDLQVLFEGALQDIDIAGQLVESAMQESIAGDVMPEADASGGAGDGIVEGVIEVGPARDEISQVRIVPELFAHDAELRHGGGVDSSGGATRGFAFEKLAHLKNVVDIFLGEGGDYGAATCALFYQAVLCQLAKRIVHGRSTDTQLLGKRDFTYYRARRHLAGCNCIQQRFVHGIRQPSTFDVTLKTQGSGHVNGLSRTGKS